MFLLCIEKQRFFYPKTNFYLVMNHLDIDYTSNDYIIINPIK